MNSKNLSRIITILVLIIVIIAIILLFQGSNDTARIELNGKTDMVIYQTNKFIDPGYEIVDVKSTNGFYVNIDGIVNTNKIGVYYLKYSLYNKKGVLVSEATRKVIVLENPNLNVDIYLNGDEEEYYFVDDYTDNGAVAYQNNKDISNLIIVDSNVKPNTVGTYEVRYQVDTNNVLKEVVRKVHIVDFDITENVDYDTLTIYLDIDCENYYYTILPDSSKSYSRSVSFDFKDVGTYDFMVYLKNGSHKEYSVTIISIDREGPVGTCKVTFDGGKTTINVTATDKSGISKYSYNGLDFYTNSTVINKIASNVVVRAYDKFNNYTDIKCKAEFGLGFKNTGSNKIGYISCGTNANAANIELDNLMKAYGYKTRDAVGAAGLWLATYKYRIPYFWGGKTVVKGVDPTWGCRKKHTDGKPCTKSLAADNSYCQYGLDCAGFTRWAFVQAGFDKSILRAEEQSEKNWGNFNASKHRYAFNTANAAYVNQIKPGDIVHKPGHVGLVIGVDKDHIQVAEMTTGGVNIDIIKKSNGVSVNGRNDFKDFVLFDDFFKMYGNS